MTFSLGDYHLQFMFMNTAYIYTIHVLKWSWDVLSAVQYTAYPYYKKSCEPLLGFLVFFMASIAKCTAIFWPSKIQKTLLRTLFKSWVTGL